MTFDMFLLSLKESVELNRFVGGAFNGFLYFTFAKLNYDNSKSDMGR